MSTLDKLWAEYSRVNANSVRSWNVAVGRDALPNCIGSHCIGIGSFAGQAWTTENYQIEVTDWPLMRLLLDLGCEATAGMEYGKINPWMHMTFVLQVGVHIWNGFHMECPACGQLNAMVDRGNGPRCWSECKAPKLKLVGAEQND